MALATPNVAQLSKENPRVGEALLRDQSYINQNTTPIAGNIVQPPPIKATASPLNTSAVKAIAAPKFVKPGSIPG